MACNFLVPAVFRVFTNMPIGFHMFFDVVKTVPVVIFASVLMRYAFNTIVPFGILVDEVILILFDAIFYKANIIPVKDKRTGLTEKWPISTTALSRSYTCLD